MEIVQGKMLKPDRNSILYESAEIITDKDEAAQLGKLLVQALVETKGFGISSNQINEKGSGFAINHIGIKCYFNPKIIAHSTETITSVEGCLSYPDLYIDIKRSERITLEYDTVDLERKSIVLTGLKAIIAQHEMDHLNGIQFFEKATKFHRQRALRRYKKNVKKIRN